MNDSQNAQSLTPSLSQRALVSTHLCKEHRKVPSSTCGLRFTHKFAGVLGSLLPQAGEGLGMRVIAREAALTTPLTPTLSRLRERELSWHCKDV